MTKKKKRQLLTILNTTEVLLFFIAVLVVFAFTTGTFSKSQWQSDNAQNLKSFSGDTVGTLSEKNMVRPTNYGPDSTNILVPSVFASEKSNVTPGDQAFSESDIMIQANELLIFDEL